MTEKRKITEDDANNLNYGIPIVLTLFLFIVNGIIFSAYYAESMLALFKIYLFFIFLILSFDFFQAKRKNKTKTIIKINGYKNVVFSALLVLLFLALNFVSSNTIFETKVFCNKSYNRSLKEYAIPPNFSKFYLINQEELKTYFHSDYLLHVSIGESIFGYKLLKQRTFETLVKQ